MPVRHIFLTGEVQVGKSTLLTRLLRQPFMPVPDGFQTVSVPDLSDGRVSVYLLPMRGARVCGAESRVGIRCGAFACFPDVFDTAGVAALAAAQDARLIVMDEIGRMEREALRFSARVLQLLDGEVPILGVVQKHADTSLCRTIRSHPAVTLVEVTAENRETLFVPLSRQLRGLLL